MSDVKSKFTLHTKYKDFVPGKDRIDIEALSPYLSSLSDFFTVLVIVAVLVFMSLCTVSMLFYYVDRDQSYVHTGHEVTAAVVACERMTKVSRITYTYTVSDTAYTNTQDLNISCRDFPTGLAIPVLYLTDRPETSQLVEGASMGGPISMGFLLAVFLVCIFAFAAYIPRYLYAQWNHRYLASKGMLLEGEITTIKGHTPGKSSQYYVRVWYTFETPRKRVLKGFAEAHRQDLKGKDLPPVGTPVTVLYADDGSHMML